MSKVDELRIKYPKITKVTFNKFVDADFTPTKKYLEFMLKTWDKKDNTMIWVTASVIIGVVKRFDSLLPYIDNKDIYNVCYTNIDTLINEIDKAEIKREEKTFNKQEHVNVLVENDRFLLVQPITHRGSLKYGANTKWCTASKNNEQLFLRYARNGCLVYLIDKTESKSKNYNKLALYHEYHNCSLNGEIQVYNMLDTTSTVKSLIKNGGWDETILFEVFTMFRHFTIQMASIVRSKNVVNLFVKTLEQLNFEEFEKSLNKLEDVDNSDYTSNIKNKVDEFLKKLNKTQYAIR